jgi:site-specific DNA recombinase
MRSLQAGKYAAVQGQISAQTCHSTVSWLNPLKEALLRGLLFGPGGDPMYPTYASKNKRKYRYYVSKAEMRFGAAGKTHERIPAAEVEAATVNQVKTVLSSPEAITAVCKSLELQGVQINEDEIVMGLHKLEDAWEQLYPAEQIRIVKLMIERVDLVTGGLKIKWHALGWKELIKEFAARGIGAELVEMEAA